MSRYCSHELVQGSLHLLNRYFSSETSLFHNAMQTQLLLTEESKTVSTVACYTSVDVPYWMSFEGVQEY